MPRMAEGCKALKQGFEHNGDYPQKFKRMGSDKVFGRYIQPMILPYYEEVQLESGKRVAAITIGQDVSKSYVVRHNDTETAYIRIGSVSRPAIREPNEFDDNLRRPKQWLYPVEAIREIMKPCPPLFLSGRFFVCYSIDFYKKKR
jgi:hypothetical protein